MDLNLNITLKWPSPVEGTLNQIVSMLQSLLTQGVKEMAVLDDLTSNVTATRDAEQSAVVLLGNLKTALDAAILSGNPQALQALSDSLGTGKAALAAAIIANTPAAPPPGP